MSIESGLWSCGKAVLASMATAAVLCSTPVLAASSFNNIQFADPIVASVQTADVLSNDSDHRFVGSHTANSLRNIGTMEGLSKIVTSKPFALVEPFGFERVDPQNKEFKGTPLFTESLNMPKSDATVFVGGANGTWRFWKNYVPDALARSEVVFGFEGASGFATSPHNKTLMDDNAETLAKGFEALGAAGVKTLSIKAYCFGGLAVKKALDIMAERGTLQKFEKVSFLSSNSPYGGYAVAMAARINSEEYLKTWGPKNDAAMTYDISPTSEFMKTLGKPLPKNVKFSMIEGAEDDLVTPFTSWTTARYSEVSNQADQRIVVPQDKQVDLPNGHYEGGHMSMANPEYAKRNGIDIFNPEGMVSHNDTIVFSKNSPVELNGAAPETLAKAESRLPGWASQGAMLRGLSKSGIESRLEAKREKEEERSRIEREMEIISNGKYSPTP